MPIARTLIALVLFVAVPATANAQQEPESLLRVRIESDDPKVELFAYHGQSVGHAANVTVVTTFYEPICLAPCNKTIPNGYPHEYFIAGKGISGTSAFSLSGYEGDVTLKVKAGSTAGRAWGGTLFTLGGISAMTGGLMLGIGAATSDYGAPDDGMSGMTKASIGMLIGGVLTAIPGLALWLSNGTDYNVVQNDGAPTTDPSTLASSDTTL